MTTHETLEPTLDPGRVQELTERESRRLDEAAAWPV